MDIEREGAKEIERKYRKICRKRFHKRDEDSLESIMQQENKQAREQIKPAKNMNRQEGTFSFPIKKTSGRQGLWEKEWYSLAAVGYGEGRLQWSKL